MPHSRKLNIRSIRLHDIPETGLDIVSTNITGEFSTDFADSLGANALYEIKLHLRSLSEGTYELSGTLKAQKGESCSRCAEDFTLAIEHRFRDVICPALDDDAIQGSRPLTPLELEQTLEQWTYASDEISIAEILRETINLEIPLAPAPPLDSISRCMHCHRDCPPFKYSEELGPKENPFAKLKILKQ